MAKIKFVCLYKGVKPHHFVEVIQAKKNQV